MDDVGAAAIPSRWRPGRRARAAVVPLAVLITGCSASSSGAAGTVAATTASTGAATTTTPPAITYYLSLGDSVGMWNGPRSYPYLLAAKYRAEGLPRLRLVDMSCSGETTSSMILHSTCAPGGSQYGNAVRFLETHRGAVALVTIGIGGNDLVGCIRPAVPATCVSSSLARMQTNLATILAGLRGAAGSGTRFVGMNIYNPLLGDWLDPGAGRALALAAVTGVSLLSADMEKRFAAAGIPVADVEGAFESTDLKRYVSSSWGRVPVAVDVACRLLDITCRRGAVEGFGDDPNTSGAVVISGAFEKVIGTLRPQG